jgi:hypothetical protein
MLQHIGRAECVPAVAALLADKEADVRESARRTLQKNPSEEAGTALRAALDKASDPAWRVAMINAVADRRDAAATAAFLKALGDADADVAIAGARALGKVGGPAAAKALADARKKAADKARPAVVDALLLAADGMVAAGKKDDAAAIYTSLYVPDEPKAIRIAALRGLIASTGPHDGAGRQDHQHGKGDPLRDPHGSTFRVRASGFVRAPRGRVWAGPATGRPRRRPGSPPSRGPT